MKQCPKCAQECDENVKFCPNCGATFSPDGQQEAAADSLLDSESVPVPPKEEPASSLPPLSEKKPKQRGPGFVRGVLGVLLCALAFVLLAAASLIWDVRDFSSEAQLFRLLKEMDASEVMSTDIDPSAPRGERLAQWLTEELDRRTGEMLPLTSRQMEEFLNSEGCKSFLAQIGADFLRDIYSGKSTEALTRGDISDLLKENSAYFSEQFGIELNMETRTALAQALERSGALDRLSTAELRNQSPEAYYFLFLGCSWAALAVLVALAVLAVLLLGRAWKSATGAIRGLGIVLIVLGLLRCVLGLLAKLLPGMWQNAVDGNYLLSAVSGNILFYHTLLPSAVILAAGVLLTVIAVAIRRIRDRRRPEEKLETA